MYQPRSLPAMPDYTTAVKEYERVAQLQERAWKPAKRNTRFSVTSQKSCRARFARKELLQQAHDRVAAEQNRAESSAANFAKLDQEVRDKIVSIAEKHKKTGKLSTEDARFLDRYGIAQDLTTKTLAASVGGKERTALEALGMFQGVDEAKEAEKKASDALVRAKEEEERASQALAEQKQKLLGQDDEASYTVAAYLALKGAPRRSESRSLWNGSATRCSISSPKAITPPKMH